MKQLLWRCRRGIKEMDILLENFVHTHYPALSDADKQTFFTLLDEADPDLWDWIRGKTQPGNRAYEPLLAILKTLRINQHAG